MMVSGANRLGLEDRTQLESRVLNCDEDVCALGAEDLVPSQDQEIFVKPDAPLITWKEFQKRVKNFVDGELHRSITMRDFSHEQIDDFKDVDDVDALSEVQNSLVDWSAKVLASGYEYIGEALESKDPNTTQTTVAYWTRQVTSMEFMTGYQDMVEFSIRKEITKTLDLEDSFPKSQSHSEKFTLIKEGWPYSKFDYGYSPPFLMDTEEKFVFTASVIDPVTLRHIMFVSFSYYFDNDYLKVVFSGDMQGSKNVPESSLEKFHLFSNKTSDSHLEFYNILNRRQKLNHKR